jgi:recombination protein RecT
MNELAKGNIEEVVLSKDMQRKFALALPKHLTAERFARIAITAITKSPKLMACTKESLVNCLLDLSQLGLEPDGRNAHLIPYGDKCTLIIDYKGYVNLARRTGEIADIHADVVCENDKFDYAFGTEGTLIHKPAFKDRGKVIAAYSFVKMKDGTSSYEVMNKEEVEEIHKRSKAGDNGPWVTDWKEMAKKTVFRRHSKWLPISSELFKNALEKDYDVPIDITPEIGKPRVSMPQTIKDDPPKENIQEATTIPAEKKSDPPQEIPEETPEEKTKTKPSDLISDKQKKRLFAIRSSLDWTEQEVKSFLKENYGTEHTGQITRADYDEIVEHIQNNPKVKP